MFGPRVSSISDEMLHIYLICVRIDWPVNNAHWDLKRNGLHATYKCKIYVPDENRSATKNYRIKDGSPRNLINRYRYLRI